MKHILVVCGAGASSTFLAHRMRKVVLARGLEVTVKAASQVGLDQRLPEFDVLLVGPHLAADFDELELLAARFGVDAALLPETVFDGGGDRVALDLALTLLIPTQPKELS
ncbi:PTS sugar transporter subunit IIB [Subtercola sp. YIM 133946]|uniref:PTS sugar transporter subunit IIB n=1 Tax=Subtercola sp. YIM 133946 TaxID=3118909 RepID=UPI002F944E97